MGTKIKTLQKNFAISKGNIALAPPPVFLRTKEDHLNNPRTAFKEAATQVCLLDWASKNNGYDVFISYLEKVQENCLKSKYIGKCTAEIRKKMHSGLEDTEFMSHSKLLDCLKERKTNLKTILKNQLKESDYYSYERVPSVFIQGNLVRGVIEGDTVGNAICDSVKTRPKECKKLHLALKKKVKRTLKFDPKNMVKEESSIFVYFFIIFSTLVLFGAIYFIGTYGSKLIIKQDIEDSVLNNMNSYNLARNTEMPISSR